MARCPGQVSWSDTGSPASKAPQEHPGHSPYLLLLDQHYCAPIPQGLVHYNVQVSLFYHYSITIVSLFYHYCITILSLFQLYCISRITGDREGYPMNGNLCYGLHQVETSNRSVFHSLLKLCNTLYNFICLCFLSSYRSSHNPKAENHTNLLGAPRNSVVLTP